MLKGEFAVGRLDLFERAGLLQPKVHEVHMDGDGKVAHPEHLRKKILQTLFGRRGSPIALPSLRLPGCKIPARPVRVLFRDVAVPVRRQGTGFAADAFDRSSWVS